MTQDKPPYCCSEPSYRSRRKPGGFAASVASSAVESLHPPEIEYSDLSPVRCFPVRKPTFHVFAGMDVGVGVDHSRRQSVERDFELRTVVLFFALSTFYYILFFVSVLSVT